MKRGMLLLMLMCCACGRGGEQAPAAGNYLQEVQQVLQALRVLDQQISQQVTGDTLASNQIVPLIRQEFRPTIARLRERVAGLQPDSTFAAVNQQLLHYLDLRLKAYDLAIQGAQEERPELFEEFARLQVQADGVGRALEEDLRTARQQHR